MGNSGNQNFNYLDKTQKMFFKSQQMLVGPVQQDNLLNIFHYKNQEKIKIIENILKKEYPEYSNINFFDKGSEKNTQENLKSILEIIQNNVIQQNVSNNIILVILNNDDNIEEEKRNISSCLKGIYQFIRPIVILGYKKEINENEKNQINNSSKKTNQNNENEKMKNNQKKLFPSHEKEILKKSDILNENIELVYYKDDTYSEIIEKIKQLYRYYNYIGDTYNIINEKLGQPTVNEKLYENNKKYVSTFNILVIGKSGGGKSTLINLLLNEKKARVGIGFSGQSNTKLFNKYIHHKYPITFIDTPGLEREYDFYRVIYYINQTLKFWGNLNLNGDGKNKIHAILYVINGSESRYFDSNEIELIKSIQQIKIQIFFVCTKSLEPIKASDYKEFIKVNLIQNFGKEGKEPLINFIYPCQLVDEKDGKFTKFGIKELLNGIYDFFEKEKKNLESIKSNNNNQNLDNPIFFSSLTYCNNNYNFEEYLNLLCNNIIKYYIDNYINNTRPNSMKMNENQKYFKLDKKKLIESLIKHLASELDGDLSNPNIINIIDSYKLNESSIFPNQNNMNSNINQLIYQNIINNMYSNSNQLQYQNNMNLFQYQNNMNSNFNPLQYQNNMNLLQYQNNMNSNFNRLGCQNNMYLNLNQLQYQNNTNSNYNLMSNCLTNLISFPFENNSRNEIENVEKIGYYIKDLFLKNIEEKSKSNNNSKNDNFQFENYIIKKEYKFKNHDALKDYFINLIKSYLTAINSLKELC